MERSPSVILQLVSQHGGCKESSARAPCLPLPHDGSVHRRHGGTLSPLAPPLAGEQGDIGHILHVKAERGLLLHYGYIFAEVA